MCHLFGNFREKNCITKIFGMGAIKFCVLLVLLVLPVYGFSNLQDYLDEACSISCAHFKNADMAKIRNAGACKESCEAVSSTLLNDRN